MDLVVIKWCAWIITSSLPILKIMVIHLAVVLPVAVPAFQVSCEFETNQSSDPEWTAILSSANTLLTAWLWQHYLDVRLMSLQVTSNL